LSRLKLLLNRATGDSLHEDWAKMPSLASFAAAVGMRVSAKF
jgi:hypothetical protein